MPPPVGCSAGFGLPCCPPSRLCLLEQAVHRDSRGPPFLGGHNALQSAVLEREDVVPLAQVPHWVVLRVDRVAPLQLSNQRGETVLELENTVMFRKREAAA